MHSTEKHVEQLLINANQALNFLRTVLDDLILKKELFTLDSQWKIFQSQQKYKKNEAALINIENIIHNAEYPLPEKLRIHLAKNLRARISAIIDESIELDKLR